VIYDCLSYFCKSFLLLGRMCKRCCIWYSLSDFVMASGKAGFGYVSRVEKSVHYHNYICRLYLYISNQVIK